MRHALRWRVRAILSYIDIECVGSITYSRYMAIDPHTVSASFVSVDMRSFLQAYGPAAAYIGAVLMGEFAILAVFILSAQGYIDPTLAFVASILGMASTDVFWFLFGFYYSTRKHNWHKKESLVRRTAAFWERVATKNIFMSLLFVKFLYGIRWATLIYFGLRRTKVKTFLYYDVIGVFVFVGVLFAVGWLAGRGIVNLLPVYDNAVLLVFGFVLAFIFVEIFHVYIRKRVERLEQKEGV